MKRAKFLALILSSIMIAGCTEGSPAELSSNAANKAVINAQNESENAETIALNNNPSTIENDVAVTESSVTDIQKVFERVSYENLSDAEQIYNSLYNWAEFEKYVTFDLHEDVDYNDFVNVERLRFPTAGTSDEGVGTTYFEPYYRISDGRMSNGVDFSMWLDSFASEVYLVGIFQDWYKEKFVVSGGAIYASHNILEYYGGWLTTSNLTLDSITPMENDAKNPIRLDFSFTDYGIDIDSTPGTTEYFTVVMSKNNGWKIDSYAGGYINIALINEFFRNEDSSDLLSQIEIYLSENPI